MDDQECSELCSCGAETLALSCHALCVPLVPCRTSLAYYSHAAPAYQGELAFRNDDVRLMLKATLFPLQLFVDGACVIPGNLFACVRCLASTRYA